MQHIFEYLINRKLTAKDANKHRIKMQHSEIWYEAEEKLPETTSKNDEGLHTNKFNTVIIEHTFNDGKGVIKFKDELTKIGENAFFNCNNLTKINIPDSVTIIGKNAFALCDNAAQINIPNSVTEIGSFAFYRCEKLTTINIPDFVTAIKDYTFYGCKKLSTINIPKSVTEIGETQFQQCIDLSKINYDGTIEQWNNIKIKKKNTWKSFIPKAIIKCIDGEMKINDM